jgi:hypothetical protein
VVTAVTIGTLVTNITSAPVVIFVTIFTLVTESTFDF